MKLENLTKHIIDDAVETFYKTVSKHIGTITKEVAGETYSIPRAPRKMGAYEFPYFFAVELDQIFRFALGGMPAQTHYILGLCDKITEILWSNAMKKKYDVDWDSWKETPLGLAVLACRTRVKLRDEEGLLTIDEVLLLGSMDREDLNDTPLASAIDEKTNQIPSKVAKEFFERERIPV